MMQLSKASPQLKIRAFYVGNFLQSQGFNRGKEERVNVRSPRKDTWKWRMNVQSVSNSLQKTYAILEDSVGNCQGQASSLQKSECCIFRMQRPVLSELGCPWICPSCMAQQSNRKHPLSSKYLIYIQVLPQVLYIYHLILRIILQENYFYLSCN